MWLVVSTYFWPYSVTDMLLTRFYVGLITLSLGEIVNTNCSTFTVVSLFYYKMMKAHRRDQAAIRQPAELLLLEESICTKGHFADLLISGWFLFMSLKEWWGYSGVVFTHRFVVKAAKLLIKIPSTSILIRMITQSDALCSLFISSSPGGQKFILCEWLSGSLPPMVLNRNAFVREHSVLVKSPIT